MSQEGLRPPFFSVKMRTADKNKNSAVYAET
jgi:hypothetical protein